MRVAADRDPYAALARERAVDVRQVEPRRLAVELDESASRAGAIEHCGEVEFHRRPLVDEAATRVGEDRQVRMIERLQESLGLAAPGELKACVDRADDVVESGEHLVGQRQRPVLEDVDLDALQYRDAADRERVDRLGLARERRRVEAVGRTQELGVVGDADVGEAGVAGRGDHRRERRAAIAPVGVDVQVALQVRAGHERRQAPLAGRVDLAAILAQLGRDPRQAHRREHLFLRAPAHLPLAAEQAVFVEFQARALRKPPDVDVVTLVAGEVVERRAEARSRHDPEVDGEPVREHDRRPRAPARDDVGDLVEAAERVDRGSGLLAADQDVEVADRLASAAETAGDHGLLDAGHRLEVPDERGGDRRGDASQHAHRRAAVLERGGEARAGRGRDARHSDCAATRERRP